MKIAIIGYGKMGKLIEALAIENGHNISFKIASLNATEIHNINIANTNVAIEFTSPETAFNNVQILLKNGVPTVCGSTGWQENLHVAQQLAVENNTAFIWASNFSIGVNLFFAFTQFIAQKMGSYTNYIPLVNEVHHTAKKDAPSGTAITIAQKVLEAYKNFNGTTNNPNEQTTKLLITYKREDPAPGFHEVVFNSHHDTITLQHNAKSRNGFVEGTLLAAQFIVNKKGVFTMEQVLGL